MKATSNTRVIRVEGHSHTEIADVLATEDPLEIRIEFGPSSARTTQAVSVTMRTPGHDEELAAGFLFTEGVLPGAGAIIGFRKPERPGEQQLTILLHDEVEINAGSIARNFYTTSSCGVCGKASVAGIRTTCPWHPQPDQLRISAQLITSLPDKLREAQAVFRETGGIHACALFGTDGRLILMREDVGRHNALDKLIGRALLEGQLPASDSILLLSGRASFELVQKAAMAGIRVIAAVGAPSSLAVEMAEEMDITLIGFLRGDRFNIYSGSERVVI
jgi:FdhD protein